MLVTPNRAYIVRDMYSVPNRHWASVMNAFPSIKEFVYREVPTSTLAFVGD